MSSEKKNCHENMRYISTIYFLFFDFIIKLFVSGKS